MTVNEKTRLLPKDYQKSYVIPISQEDINNNSSNDNNIHGSDYDYDSYALTKAELTFYIDDPFWIRVRYICFSLYWLLCIVALFISCYIAVSALESGLCSTAGPSALNDGNNSLVSSTVSPLDQTATESTIESVTAESSGVVFRLLTQPA